MHKILNVSCTKYVLMFDYMCGVKIAYNSVKLQVHNR